MNVVLLSGGSGKRLWPLSNETQSKQFLKLLKNDRGEFESMVQRVMRQLLAAHPEANVYVSSNQSQAATLRRQVGNIETVLEPSRRDTFPAVALAAAYLRYVKGLGESDVFLACPIDPFAESAYFELLAEVCGLVTSGRYNIGLLGVKPTYPSAKYGYIKQAGGEVTGFVEKPGADAAEKMIAGGALWNCGVFALRIGYVLEHARKYAEFESFEQLHAQYGLMPRISFDYEVVEKEASIGVVPYNGVWKDLGTWITLTEEMGYDSLGDDVLISESSKNTHVLNMLGLPIIAQDIPDAVVVASHDGILVSSKAGSSYLKPLADKINLRPMYEQQGWGNYRVLEIKRGEDSTSLVRRIHVDAGQTFGGGAHDMECEVWTIVSGKGILELLGEEKVVSRGSVVHVPPGVPYTLLAATELEFIEVQIGDENNE